MRRPGSLVGKKFLKTNAASMADFPVETRKKRRGLMGGGSKLHRQFARRGFVLEMNPQQFFLGRILERFQRLAGEGH